MKTAVAAVRHAATCAGALPRAWTQTSRLALREFAPFDLDALVSMHQDARLRRYLVDDYPLHEPAVARMFLQRIAQIYRQHEGLGIWHATALQPQPRFAGWFNLMPMAERPGEVELGGRLVPAAWGGGLGIEGAEVLLNHASDTLRLSRVWGICHPDNRSAHTVLAALGFEPLGALPYDGHIASHYRIDLNAWRELRNTPRAIRLRRALGAGLSRHGRRAPNEQALPTRCLQGESAAQCAEVSE